MKKLMVVLLVLFLAYPAFGAKFDLTLQWDENTEPDLATGERPRYKIYYKTDASGAGVKSNFTNLPLSEFRADEGPTTVNVTVAKDESTDPDIVQFTLHNLEDTKSYFFAVTALDEVGNESDLSDEVSIAGIVRIAPVIDTLAVNGQTGTVATNNSNIAVNLKANDDQKIAGYVIQVDAPDFNESNIIGITPVQTIDFNLNRTLTGDGPHTVYVWAIDEMENVSDRASVSVTLDTVAPAKPNVSIWQIIKKWLKGWF